MGEDAADRVNELKAGAQRAEILSGAVFYRQENLCEASRTVGFVFLHSWLELDTIKVSYCNLLPDKSHLHWGESTKTESCSGREGGKNLRSWRGGGYAGGAREGHPEERDLSCKIPNIPPLSTYSHFCLSSHQHCVHIQWSERQCHVKLPEIGHPAANTFQHDLAWTRGDWQPWRKSGPLRPPAHYRH